MQLLFESPGSPMEPTPPHRLCLETSFTDLNPENLPASNHSSSQSEVPDAVAMSAPNNWEYNVGLEDQFASSNHRNRKALSNPPLAHRVTMVRDEWIGLAPLATPETLSDVSSVSSRGSSRIGSGRFVGRLSGNSAKEDASLRSSEAECCVRKPQREESHYRQGQTKEMLVLEDVDDFTESSHLLAELPLFKYSDDTPNNVMVTEVVVEMEPRLVHESNILELESDGEGPNYEGARLSFDLSQGTSTQTSEDTGYHGDQEVFLNNSPQQQVSRMNHPSTANDGVDNHGGSSRISQSSYEEVTSDCNNKHPVSSRQGSCHSRADTMSDVYDPSLNSNPSPLTSPASLEAASSVIHPQSPDNTSECKQTVQIWMGESMSPLRSASHLYGSPKQWKCSRQIHIPRDIIPQARMGCEEPPRMCFHRDVSPDESSV